MAWHMGHPLSQTIFTSLYIDRLLNSKQVKWESIRFGNSGDGFENEPLILRVLRAYCLGLIKTCSHVNNRIKSEHFYEVCCLIDAIVAKKLIVGFRKRISLPIRSTEICLTKSKIP